MAILTYLDLPGKVTASGAAGEPPAVATVQGGPVEVYAMSGANIGASNGVIHVIGRVLLPQQDAAACGAALGPPPRRSGKPTRPCPRFAPPSLHRKPRRRSRRPEAPCRVRS